MTVGLRFRKSQARTLRALLERAEIREVREAVSLLRAAAAAARVGEPMLLQCADLDEAKLTAQGFANWGVVPPTIEEVSGA